MTDRDIKRYECEDSEGRFILETDADLDTSEEARQKDLALRAKTSKATLKIAKKDYERQLIYGVVLSPYEIDSWKDYENDHEVEDAAHRYMVNVWKGEKPEAIGAEHEKPIRAIPLESFIAPVDFRYEGSPDEPQYIVKKGDWVVVSFIADKKEFEKCVNGEYVGYSMQGTGYRRKVEGLGSS